ncbi:MAG: SBBP repeat-containing protein, partial [Methanoregula sp.]|nr:SBBP repeat-containing protein [Methanoregula sp.]
MQKPGSLNQIVLVMLAFLCIVSLIAGVSALSDGAPRGLVTPTPDVVVHEGPDLLTAQDQNVTIQTLPMNETLAEVASVPPGTPDPRTRGELRDPRDPIQEGTNNPAPSTPSNKIVSTSGSETYTFVTKWGTLGSSYGQFSEPWSVAVDSSDNVYVADFGNYRIQKFSPDGTYLAWWRTQDSGGVQYHPYGVAVDSSGNVYVADHDNNRIQKFSSTGTFLTKWGTQGTGDGQLYFPWGLVVDSSDNVYVADYNNNRIQKFS